MRRMPVQYDMEIGTRHETKQRKKKKKPVAKQCLQESTTNQVDDTS